MSNSLQPHESQHARPPCPSPTPGVHSDSHLSSQCCHPAISSLKGNIKTVDATQKASQHPIPSHPLCLPSPAQHLPTLSARTVTSPWTLGQTTHACLRPGHTHIGFRICLPGAQRPCLPPRLFPSLAPTPYLPAPTHTAPKAQVSPKRPWNLPDPSTAPPVHGACPSCSPGAFFRTGTIFILFTVIFRQLAEFLAHWRHPRNI